MTHLNLHHWPYWHKLFLGPPVHPKNWFNTIKNPYDTTLLPDPGLNYIIQNNLAVYALYLLPDFRGKRLDDEKKLIFFFWHLHSVIPSVLGLTMETMKLFTSFLILIGQFSGSVQDTVRLLYREIICRPSDTALLAVTDLYYITQNNLVVYASMEVFNLLSVDISNYLLYLNRKYHTYIFAIH